MSNYSMYLITDEKACRGKDLYRCIEDSIQGGANIVQLREKNMDTKDFYQRALKIKEICHRYKVPFLINDRIDIALAVDADGVHLGQSDMPIEIARRLLGENKIIGISAKNLEDAKDAQSKGANYIGVGAIFATSTKQDASCISKDRLRELTENIDIPVLAIGGIKLNNIDYLSDLGVDGICVISEILNSDDCKKKTEELVKKFGEISAG